LVDPVAQTPIGGTVRVSYMRNKQAHDATVTVEDRNKIFPDRASSDAQGAEPDAGQAIPAEFGLQVEELAPDRARRSSFGNNHGIVVNEVAPVSFAEDVGLMRGDLITEINHMAVSSMAGYRQTLATLRPGQEVVFKVLRHADGDRVLTVLLAGTMPAAQR
jgi:serine protease Do